MKLNDEILEKYKSGFGVNHPKESMCDEEWLFSKEHSSNTKLVFLGYDANLFPMRDFSEWPETDWKQKVIRTALKRTKDFKGEVWLDNVKIKEEAE